MEAAIKDKKLSFLSAAAAAELVACRRRMSWNQTPPPMSPRKPKIQHSSWDGAPAINLYDRDSYDGGGEPLPNAAKKSPSGPALRKVNYGKYCLPNPQHQMSDPGTYYSSALSRSPKSPKSPGTQVFEFELSSAPQQQQSCRAPAGRSPLKAVGSNRRYYEDSSTSDSAPAMLTSSSSSRSKYEYGAISPKFDSPGKGPARHVHDGSHA